MPLLLEGPSEQPSPCHSELRAPPETGYGLESLEGPGLALSPLHLPAPQAFRTNLSTFLSN